jgi:hypothetical protein
MEPDSRELELSKVRTFLDETDGKGFHKKHYCGYHPEVYNKGVSKETSDKWVAELCARCQMLDITKQSLELQIWWRDHQEWDEDRKREERLKKMEELQEKIDALTKAEQILLARIPDWKCIYEATDTDLERTMMHELIEKGLVETQPNIDATVDVRACLLKGVLIR